jgi:hypothetical protein
MNKLLALLFLVTLSAAGADYLPYHPFRQIGTNYYDLRPLYSWRLSVQAKAQAETKLRQEADGAAMGAMTSGGNANVAAANAAAARLNRGLNDLGTAQRACPLPQWIIPGGPVLRVVQVWKPDLLLLSAPQSSEVVLKHYPGHDQLADGDPVSAYALRAGVHRWKDRDGIAHSVPLYDYGIPYTPDNRSTGSASHPGREAQGKAPATTR